MSQKQEAIHPEPTSVATELRQFDAEDVELVSVLRRLENVKKEDLAALLKITEEQLAARIQKTKQCHPLGETIFNESVKGYIGLDGYNNIVGWPVTFYVYESLYHICEIFGSVDRGKFKEGLIKSRGFEEAYQKTQQQTAELNPFTSPVSTQEAALDLILDVGLQLKYIVVPKEGGIASAPRVWVELPYFQDAHHFDSSVKKKSRPSIVASGETQAAEKEEFLEELEKIFVECEGKVQALLAKTSNDDHLRAVLERPKTISKMAEKRIAELYGLPSDTSFHFHDYQTVKKSGNTYDYTELRGRLAGENAYRSVSSLTKNLAKSAKSKSSKAK